MSIIAQYLDKPSLVSVLTKAGIPESKIEESWQLIEFTFATAFMKHTMDLLDKSTLDGMCEGVDVSDNNKMMPVISARIAQYIKDNPTKLDVKAIADKAVKNVYDFILKGESDV